jgi:NitT/TauT family transport system ATP-binding protein
VRCQLAVQLPRPRDPDSAEVRELIDEVYALMTAGTGRTGRAAEEPARAQIADRLPDADIGRMEGLMELLASDAYGGRADLPKLAEDTELTDDELLPLAQALSLLQLARIENGDLHLTPLGRRYVDGDHTLRQQLFGQQLLTHVALAAHIRHSLEQEPSGALAEEPFLKLLSESLAAEHAERVLRTAIEWGRYGEVFEYDFNTGVIHLPEGSSKPTEEADG